MKQIIICDFCEESNVMAISNTQISKGSVLETYNFCETCINKMTANEFWSRFYDETGTPNLNRLVKEYEERISITTWLIEHPLVGNNISVRLHNILLKMSQSPYSTYIDEITEKNFMRVKGAGKKSWEEFQDIILQELSYH